MAVPRVFISSTCYDLADERDGLGHFCASFGFDTTLSERGDVFYHPDLHTHLSCIRETSNCHIFILIIGGRFGGKYKVDPTKSITNAEYDSAIQNGAPVFTFVKQDVLNDHNLWQKNRDKPFSKEIHYPSIDNQDYAEEIFCFIDTVRSAAVNNGVFGFRLTKDIYEILRKQWAAMMFDYLQNRNISKQISVTNDALSNLSVVSGKIEELVKNIYRNVDADGASKAIEDIDQESLAEEFLASVASAVKDKKFISELRWKNRVELPRLWWDFLVNFSFCKVKTEKDANNNDLIFLEFAGNRVIYKLFGGLIKSDEVMNEELTRGYETFLKLKEDVQTKLVSKYFWTEEDSARIRAMKTEQLSP